MADNQDGKARERRMVDAFTRAQHALLVLACSLAYLTGEVDALRPVHVTMGYTAGGVMLLRLIWGLVGPRRVRLSGLGHRLTPLSQWRTLSMQHGQMNWPSLLLPLSVVGLMGAVCTVTLSGYITYMAFWGNRIQELHESLGNVLLLLVMVHVSVVMALRVLRWGKSPRPMFTGRVWGQGPDLVRHDLKPLAWALLVAALAFWTWQAVSVLEDPGYLQQPRWLHPHGGYVGDDDD